MRLIISHIRFGPKIRKNQKSRIGLRSVVEAKDIQTQAAPPTPCHLLKKLRFTDTFRASLHYYFIVGLVNINQNLSQSGQGIYSLCNMDTHNLSTLNRSAVIVLAAELLGYN